MNIPDDIFDIALTRLLDGEAISEIVKDYPEYQNDLVSLLSVSEMGMNIPKLVPPAPYKRHLYENKPSSASRFVELLSMFRVAAIPLALVIALLGGRTIVNATNNSLPGDKLYSLKRASENARLALTSNPEKIAVIHVELMQNRIDEVKKAASTGNETAENAAIAELQSQTQKTIAEVAPVATANAISKQDSTLLDTLLAVNKQQKDVLQGLQKNEDATGAAAAATALADTKKNDQTLAKIVATVNDQTLADLPNKISVTGNITSHYGNVIIVEKNYFTIDDKTTITDINGQLANADSIKSGRATITGVKNDEGVTIAKQILLLPQDAGVVKGATDTKPVDSKPAVITPKPVTPKPVDPAPTTPQTQQQPATPATQTDTSTPTTPQAQGSFIVEPSDSQYAN